ncbi:hypothetical protein H839_14389 [Parageobacillus genomosp. 1]|uniref:Uncharacterized protein n=1 Tax=Parageobacillus genomosp. 1 TaxID=1295642 RepID=A0ABC9VDL9_9BACL|nr:hypothetical protein [Parageobacillus genomosp. 1]EZP76473.1 hypothetical protein H839_14389 [Parageobacillus genomosp. 1]
MIVWKKAKIISLLFVLIISFCFPLGGTSRAAATTADEDSGFIIHADKVVGTLDLGGIIIGAPGVIIGELPIAFLQAKIYGLTLTKLVRTDYGTMVLSIQSNDIANAKLMNMTVTKLHIGGLCFDGVPVVEQCLRDVTLVATKLTTDHVQIPNMSVETSFDPKEVSEAQSIAQSLLKQDLEKEAEHLILAIHEHESGKTDNEIEAFKEVKKDMAKFQEQADQMDRLLNDAEQRRKQIENEADRLEKEIKQGNERIGNLDVLKETVQHLSKQYNDFTIQLKSFTFTLQKMDEMLQQVKESLEAKQKTVQNVSETLKKLKLGEKSEIGQEVAETKKKLHSIEEKVDQADEQINGLQNEIHTWSDRINQMNKSIEALKQYIGQQHEQEEKSDNGSE